MLYYRNHDRFTPTHTRHQHKQTDTHGDKNREKMYSVKNIVQKRRIHFLGFFFFFCSLFLYIIRIYSSRIVILTL